MKTASWTMLAGFIALGAIVSIGGLAALSLLDVHITAGIVFYHIGAGLIVGLIPYAVLRSTIFKRLAKLRTTIQAIYDGGDLTRRAEVDGNDPISITAKAFNNLVYSFQGIVGKVVFNSLEVTKTVNQLINETKQVAHGSDQQRAAADATKQAMEAMDSDIRLSNDKAKHTSENAHTAHELSERGSQITTHAAAEIERISRSIEQSALTIAELGEHSQAISGIVKVIHDIADQTNLLALNAAIEAARAGEQGRGFAVVADEVRKLAERTSSATSEISNMIQAMQNKTHDAIASIQKDSAEAKQGAELARQANEALHQISHGATATMENAEVIVRVIGQQISNSQNIGQHMESILKMAENNNAAMNETLQEANMLESLASNLKEIDTVFKLGELGQKTLTTHQRLTEIVSKGAATISQLLDEAVKNRQITLEDLFDQNYVPIPNTQPAKFHTKFDTLTDKILLSYQESLLDQHPEIAYAIACDLNGYVPTHNLRYTKPLTGNAQIDTVNNRTKRIFSDPVGKKCGAHEHPYLQQTYRRDTGEIMHDMSAPVYVMGKHWGGFRIGYRTD